MHYLYIIYSRDVDKYYVGETAQVSQRLQAHNKGFYSGSYTKIARDWELKLSVSFDTRESALSAERFIKRMKSRKFIEKVIANPDIIISRFH